MSLQTFVRQSSSSVNLRRPSVRCSATRRRFADRRTSRRRRRRQTARPAPSLPKNAAARKRARAMLPAASASPLPWEPSFLDDFADHVPVYQTAEYQRSSLCRVMRLTELAEEVRVRVLLPNQGARLPGPRRVFRFGRPAVSVCRHIFAVWNNQCSCEMLNDRSNDGGFCIPCSCCSTRCFTNIPQVSVRNLPARFPYISLATEN